MPHHREQVVKFLGLADFDFLDFPDALHLVSDDRQKLLRKEDDNANVLRLLLIEYFSLYLVNDLPTILLLQLYNFQTVFRLPHS
jgi:hypothetical protein